MHFIYRKYCCLKIVALLVLHLQKLLLIKDTSIASITTTETYRLKIVSSIRATETYCLKIVALLVLHLQKLLLIKDTSITATETYCLEILVLHLQKLTV